MNYLYRVITIGLTENAGDILTYNQYVMASDLIKSVAADYYFDIPMALCGTANEAINQLREAVRTYLVDSDMNPDAFAFDLACSMFDGALVEIPANRRVLDGPFPCYLRPVKG